MTRPTVFALSTLILLAAAGCASVDQAYIPRTVGAKHAAVAQEGLRLLLHSVDEVGRLGEPLQMRVTVRNDGTSGVWVPSHPQVVMLWTYPNGRHDNFLVDPPQPEHFTKASAVHLEPGEGFERTVEVETYYFPEPGITEFQAVLRVAGSTNRELRPFWTGHARSNPFGVLLLDARDPYAAAVTATPDRRPSADRSSS